MKHAIMIMAHADWEGLKHLIQLYDDEDVDFIVHINKRSGSWSDEIVKGITSKSFIYIAPRQVVSYCNYTQVNAIVSLLKTARKYGPYNYYHLISGSDLPLHPLDEFKKFFQLNNGKQFIGFSNNYNLNNAKHRSFFSNGIRISKGVYQKILIQINKILQRLQSILNIDLARNYNGTPRKGADWWSINDEAARILIDNEYSFKKSFKYTYCPSELFAQTILSNILQSESIYNFENECVGSLREIDWKRGRPYVWRKDDYEYLINSHCMFARKFDKKIDSEIIELISKHVSKQ